MTARCAAHAEYTESTMSLAHELSELAVECLHVEVDTYPKPGLVSHVDNGAHRDMDASLLHRSAEGLAPYFVQLALAGARNAEMEQLRQIGIAAEAHMLGITQGVNTHRGAIFGLGLLVAAAGLRSALPTKAPLGRIVAERWGPSILNGPAPGHSHGALVTRRYAVGGAREEAARGFPAAYGTGLVALRAGRQLARGDEQAARVQACFALVAVLDDTNLLYRAGRGGLHFAQAEATGFLRGGGVAMATWREQACEIHRRFVARNLSPGGAADLLGITLFIDAEERRFAAPPKNLTGRRQVGEPC
ncbi:triphosphoribosyl-dephospho-CoA synthase MdcB [Pseudomonas typographi]|uniref:triphosphoribosyl-dephospho-CoA synthase MdcB n=1 Tax=Pseudomonas typographi TaxID=2715964 RepID=UPI0019330280|nr:triphosphoribosyl-dephospho-CoA synthase MdcB [Pseudomonas typographi]